MCITHKFNLKVCILDEICAELNCAASLQFSCLPAQWHTSGQKGLSLSSLSLVCINMSAAFSYGHRANALAVVQVAYFRVPFNEVCMRPSVPYTCTEYLWPLPSPHLFLSLARSLFVHLFMHSCALFLLLSLPLRRRCCCCCSAF